MHPERPLLALILAGLLLVGCAGTDRTASQPATAPPVASTPPAGPVGRVLPHPVALPAAFEQAIEQGTRTRVGLPGPDYWQQEATYTLTARLHPEAKRLEGTGRIIYTNNAPDSLFTLHLELAQNLHRETAAHSAAAEVTRGVALQRVALNGQKLPERPGGRARYATRGTQLVLVPDRPIPPNTSVEIEVDWSFTIPQAGAGGRMGHSQDNLFFIAYWYPILSVYDDVEGWHTDPFLGRAEFYAGFGDYTVTVEAPEGWIVAATGTLQNPEEVLDPAVLQRMRRAHASDTPIQVLGPDDFGTVRSPDGLRWQFTARHMRDFAFSATRASSWEAARTPVGDRDGDGVVDSTHVNTFYRALAPLWQDVTRYQQQALTFLSDYTGFPYPWPHMTAVEGGGIIGGGMEFPMMTLMGDYNAAGPAALYNVTAHELAHMWIPMIVSTNERRYSWIDEGSTTFAENQARMDFYPGPNHNLPDQQAYLNVARSSQEGEVMRRSDYHYSPVAFGTASYSKPATLLVALRALIGEATFLRAYRSFIASWAFKHPYPYDFFHTFEQVSGQKLDWFWRSWYHETWTLDQAVADVRQQDGTTEIVIEDRGRVPMPVHLAVTLANGEMLRRELPVETWLEGATRASLTVATEAPVERVEIDPEQHFPDIDRSNNVWTGLLD